VSLKNYVNFLRMQLLYFIDIDKVFYKPACLQSTQPSHLKGIICSLTIPGDPRKCIKPTGFRDLHGILKFHQWIAIRGFHIPFNRFGLFLSYKIYDKAIEVFLPLYNEV